MQLSVLSALARANVDPWEEAARLAIMPKTTAEKTLATTLVKVPTWNYTSSESEEIAARLVELLPQDRGLGSSVRASSANREEIHLAPWLVWLSISIAISLISSRQHHEAISKGAEASTSSAAPALQRGISDSGSVSSSSLKSDRTRKNLQ